MNATITKNCGFTSSLQAGRANFVDNKELHKDSCIKGSRSLAKKMITNKLSLTLIENIRMCDGTWIFQCF